MKKILTILTLLFFAVITAQEYRSMLQANNLWIGFLAPEDEGGPITQFYEYRFNDATITFNEKQYKGIEGRFYIDSPENNEWSDWYLQFYLAENIPEKKVYIYYPFHQGGTEYLLYDFNLNVGDEIPFEGFFYGDFPLDEPIVITEINYQTVFGIENIKSYHTNYAFEYPLILYEGIGNSHGLNCISIFSVICRLDNFTYHLNTSEFNLNDTKIYPNPFSNQIQIDSQKPIKQLQLFDMTGKIMETKSSVAELNSQLGKLNSGVYILTITFHDNQKQAIKLIKK